VTGYATGSITGSPRGWTSNYDAAGGEIDLPRLVVELDAAWSPVQVSAVTSTQGAGESPTPLLVLADGTGYVVASVQPVAELGPGRGEPVQLGGHGGTLVRRSNGVLQAVVDLDATTRALVSSGGVDEATLSAIVGTLRQQDGAWVMDAPSGSTLQPVATTTPSSYRQRTIGWSRPLDPVTTTTTAVPGDPAGIKLVGSEGETVQLVVSTGGAYEFYGLVAQRSGWSRVVPAADGRTQLAGVDVVAAVTFEDGGGGSTVLAYDSRGFVYQIDRFQYVAVADGISPGELAPVTLRVVPATDAGWSALIATAAQRQIERAAEDQAAMDKKMAEVAAAGGAVSTETTMPPAAPPVTTPPTTAP
jgi:hypothetical protein